MRETEKSHWKKRVYKRCWSWQVNPLKPSSRLNIFCSSQEGYRLEGLIKVFAALQGERLTDGRKEMKPSTKLLIYDGIPLNRSFNFFILERFACIRKQNLCSELTGCYSAYFHSLILWVFPQLDYCLGSAMTSFI